MKKKIKIEEAVGTRLSHDITEVRPGEFKGPAFRKGHKVCEDDLCHLQRLGKNHLYVIDVQDDEIHENDASSILAKAIAGEGVLYKDEPREGKINLKAEFDGLLKVDTVALAAFNMVDEVMCATLHNNSMVKKGEIVAATRPIPLIMKRAPIERAAMIAEQNKAIVSVRKLRSAKVGLVITGSEVYHGVIEDKFEPILKKKMTAFGSEVITTDFSPDIEETIAEKITAALDKGCDLIILSGGMSVDPDDVTRKGIKRAGATDMNYGASALPGAMFLVAYIGDVPLLGVPACGLYHRITVFDLMLPRILTGERVGNKELALLGHGGLCKTCAECTYPHCPFGKGM